MSRKTFEQPLPAAGQWLERMHLRCDPEKGISCALCPETDKKRAFIVRQQNPNLFDAT